MAQDALEPGPNGDYPAFPRRLDGSPAWSDSAETDGVAVPGRGPGGLVTPMPRGIRYQLMRSGARRSANDSLGDNDMSSTATLTRIDRLELAFGGGRCDVCRNHPVRLVTLDGDTGLETSATMPPSGCPSCGRPPASHIEIVIDGDVDDLP